MSAETMPDAEPTTKPPRRWRYRGDLWGPTDNRSFLLIVWWTCVFMFCALAWSINGS